MTGFNPNKAYEESFSRKEDDTVVRPDFGSKKSKDKAFAEAAEVIDMGPRRMAAHDPYANEKPHTWNCDKHKKIGIKEGEECPSCKKERQDAEREAEKREKSKKRA